MRFEPLLQRLTCALHIQASRSAFMCTIIMLAAWLTRAMYIMQAAQLLCAMCIMQAAQLVCAMCIMQAAQLLRAMCIMQAARLECFALMWSSPAISSPAVSHGPLRPCSWPSAATRTGALSAANVSWSIPFSGLMRHVDVAISAARFASVPVVRRSIAAQRLAIPAPCMALPR